MSKHGGGDPMKSQFLALAITDKTLFHATIAVAALHLALISNGVPFTVRFRSNSLMKAPAYQVHKDEAIQGLKQAVTPAFSNDTAIGSAILIAFFEVRNRKACPSTCLT